MSLPFHGRDIHGVLLDLDGTLYDQRPLRVRMALQLAHLPLTGRSWSETREVWRGIAAFRRVREELRDLGDRADSLEDLQYSEPARRIGLPAERLRAIVAEWIHQRPLPHLAACRRPGLEAFLDHLTHGGIRIGVFSDHPVEAKLEALGLREHVSLCLCATDPDINAFKPHPRGFLAACTAWGLVPEQVLYVGDRAEVDAVGAEAAGMRCALIGSRSGSTRPFSTFGSLQDAFARAD